MDSARTGSPFDASWPMRQWVKAMSSAFQAMTVMQGHALGLSRYSNEFARSFVIALNNWTAVERRRLTSGDPVKTFEDYTRLGMMNLTLYLRSVTGAMKLANDLGDLERDRLTAAVVNTVLGSEGEDLEGYLGRQAAVARLLANEYGDAVMAVEKEYGFHFERYDRGPFAETDRFVLWRVEPTDPNVTYDPKRKPVVIIPPYVLGSNVLAFLPGQRRSYAHAFANEGIPTYIRVMKDLHANEPVQVMTGEDDVNDTRVFLEQLHEEHGQPATLNGYCQGGFSALCGLASGEYDGLVDTLITCVSPMDGTRSRGLSEGFLNKLPRRFNDLDYGLKTLPSGVQVADGRLMGWVYKLKSIEGENPISTYLRDYLMFASQGRTDVKLSTSAMAITYWLNNERTDLPLAITKMSFASYNHPITPEGVLPVRLFDRELNVGRVAEMGVRWQICYGEKDDLVEKECALAPLDWVEAEVAEFPRGHVAIATSWSDPKSACALHTRFGEGGKYRGPVRFQLDVEAEAASGKPVKAAARPKRSSKNGKGKS